MSLIACLFQNKVVFPLTIVPVYGEPLFSGQLPLSGHLSDPER